MVRSNPVKIFFILVFFLGVFVLSQDKQVNEDDKELREEILAVYQSKGEQGLRDFVKSKTDKITKKFIVDFAKLGFKERSEEWLKICEIMADVKNDEKSLADVYCKMGEYYRITAKNEKAIESFEKALPIYVKLNDIVGQGNVYLGKGIVYYDTLEYPRAQEMYDKAMSFFEKSGDLLGQAHVYKRNGNSYLYSIDYSKADELYDKALSLFEKVGNLRGQGNVFGTKGEIYLRTGKYSKALEMYAKALTFLEKDGDPLGQCSVYYKMGETYYCKLNFTKALEMFDRSLFFSEKAKITTVKGSVYLRKGDIYLQTGNNLNALEMYDKALRLFENVGDILNMGNVYLSKAQLYFYRGDYKMAEKLLDKALPIFNKASDPGGQCNVYLLKGNIYIYTGDIKKAGKMFDKALTFFEKNPNPTTLANIFQGKGNVYFYTGDFSKALEMYDRSIFFNYMIRNHVGLGNTYRCKGDIFLFNGDTLKALDMYERALSSFEIFGEPRGFGSVYLRKGDIYLKSSSISRARDMYKKALPFFEKAGDLLDQGNIHMLIGETFFYTGEDKKALKMYEKAIPFFEKTGELRGQGTVYLRRGDIYFKKRKYSEALEMYEKAIPHFEKAGALINQASAFRGIGDISFRNAEYSKALEMYEKALVLDTKIGDLVSEASTLCRKARFFARQGRKKKNLSFYEKVIDNIEKIRNQTASSAMKMSFLKEAYEEYQEATVFLLENKYDKRGFVCVESLKARVFLDRMSEGLVPREKGLKPGLKEKHDRLVGKLSFLSKEMHKTDLKEEKKLQQLKEQYREVENEFEELRIKIRLENPLYAAVRYPQPVSARELQKKVLKKGEIMLSYFISQEKIYVFLISKKRFKLVSLEVKAEKIKSHANRFLLAVNENNTGDMERCGKLLYRGLFKPIESELKGGWDIIIIPDSHLEKIPFESFIMDEEKSGRPIYLLEKYRLKYVQSASILSILRKHYRRDNKTKSFIEFGDPVYDYENFKQSNREPAGTPLPRTLAEEIRQVLRGRYDRAGGTWNRLPHSGEEVKAIARLFEKKSQKCTVYLREQATEENANAAEMKTFDYIHIAGHGLFNDDFQCLVLSQLPPDQSSEDGYFTLNEIMNCDYNAKLVVLSACQTGSGKMERAEGVTGLTKAVMYAGTPAVVASLWEVDDPATKKLMVTFYRNMLESNLEKTEALRQAKLELIKGEKYSSPLFWSAFVMYGE